MNYITVNIDRTFLIRVTLIALALGGMWYAYERGKAAGIQLVVDFMSSHRTAADKSL